MILFGWRKRIALAMCLFILLGSVSYLSGAVKLDDTENVKNFHSNNYLNFFQNASPLRIFNKLSQADIAWDEVGGSLYSRDSDRLTNRSKFVNQLKIYVKTKIIDKLRTLKPTIAITNKDFMGYFLYKWISANILLVTIKFKLISSSHLSWFYDQFSVVLE